MTRSLVAVSVAVVLIAALVPGVAALLDALVEPVWTPGEVVVVPEGTTVEPTFAPRSTILPRVTGLRAPPAPLA